MALIGNAAGDLVLGGSVLPATFGGPPIVCFGSLLSATDPRWAAALSFAANFSTPLTGVYAPLIGAATMNDLVALTPWLLLMRRFWSANQIGPAPVWVAGGGPYGAHDSIAHPAFCGPVLVMPVAGGQSLSTLVADEATTWDWSATVARSTQYHLYGAGMLSASTTSPYVSPPIYPLNVSPPTYTAQLAALVKLWKAPPAPTPASLAALAALEDSRPGASRYFHPSLLPYVLTARP